MSKKTSFPELNIMLRGWGKKFGDAFANIGPKYEPADPIPTGSATFDSITGIGGIAKGRIVEIFGPESSGKTSLCLFLMGQYKRTYPEDERPMAIVDIERSINAPLMESLGIDPSGVLFVYPDTAEQGLQAILDLNQSGAVSLILVDSVDGFQTANYLKKDIGEADMQGIAKLMGQTLRQVSKICIDKDVTNIFINQIRDSMEMYGAKTTTPGGKALRFYATQRIEMMTQKESSKIPDAFLMRPKLVKNKCGPPHKKAPELHFKYAKGFDIPFDLITLAKQLGLVRLAGRSGFVKFGPNAPEEKLSTEGGQDGLYQYLVDNPQDLERLRLACLAMTSNTPAEEEPEEEVGDEDYDPSEDE